MPQSLSTRSSRCECANRTRTRAACARGECDAFEQGTLTARLKRAKPLFRRGSNKIPTRPAMPMLCSLHQPTSHTHCCRRTTNAFGAMPQKNSPEISFIGDGVVFPHVGR